MLLRCRFLSSREENNLHGNGLFIYQAPLVMTHCFQLKTGINWPL